MRNIQLLRLRLFVSIPGAVVVAVLLGRIQLFPDTSRRTEIVFLLALGLVLFCWSLADALIALGRSRRGRARKAKKSL